MRTCNASNHSKPEREGPWEKSHCEKAEKGAIAQRFTAWNKKTANWVAGASAKAKSRATSGMSYA